MAKNSKNTTAAVTFFGAKQQYKPLPPIALLPATDSLKIAECFVSLQGEAAFSGQNTVFLRLVGCPLRCSYCDSEYAFHGGERLSFAAIEQKIASFATENICITGGEPLAQRNTLSFLSKLCTAGYRVSLETSGALSIADVDRRVHIVMDIKTPSSAQSQRNHLENLQFLKPSDEIKFVIGNRHDYKWSKDFIHAKCIDNHARILFSPSYQKLAAATLAGWIIEDRLKVKFQIQLHKYLWGDIKGV